MIFQVLLIIALCFLVVYAYFQRRNAPVISLSVLGLALGALVLAVDPDLANALSRSVGVGRGADLILYCFNLISLVAIFNLHLRFRSGDQHLTRVVRALALITARQPESIVGPGTPGRDPIGKRSLSVDPVGLSPSTDDGSVVDDGIKDAARATTQGLAANVGRESRTNRAPKGKKDHRK